MGTGPSRVDQDHCGRGLGRWRPRRSRSRGRTAGCAAAPAGTHSGHRGQRGSRRGSTHRCAADWLDRLAGLRHLWPHRRDRPQPVRDDAESVPPALASEGRRAVRLGSCSERLRPARHCGAAGRGAARRSFAGGHHVLAEACQRRRIRCCGSGRRPHAAVRSRTPDPRPPAVDREPAADLEPDRSRPPGRARSRRRPRRPAGRRSVGSAFATAHRRRDGRGMHRLRGGDQGGLPRIRRGPRVGAATET
jgi:hypothetical protein